MKKIFAVICVIFLLIVFTQTAFAGNESASFVVDADLAAAGSQGLDKANGIGAKVYVGFAIYAQQFDTAKGFTITFEWDPDKAIFVKSKSYEATLDDDITVNGVEITLPIESNILPGNPLVLETGENGSKEISIAVTSDNYSTTPDGLLYLPQFRTALDFQEDTLLEIKVKVIVSDKDLVKKNLKPQYFHVNTEVSVERKTWGEIKNQFKDF